MMISDRDQINSMFPTHLQSALEQLVKIAHQNAVGSDEISFAPRDELATVDLVVAALASIGIYITTPCAFQIWLLVSENKQAHWLDGPATSHETLAFIVDLCMDIHKDKDYAVFSGMG
ncbi:hypothetical protein [Acetobacter pasteurianus]|nr:hypothetical protein [Acetobacter pasteurianus]